MNLPLMHPSERPSASLEVIGLGFSRTGTESIKLALQKLGYVPTHHGYDVFSDPAQRNAWKTAIQAKYHGNGIAFDRAQWDVILAGCRAATDVPHILFAEELTATYPEARVILTTRDVDSWWNSYKETIAQLIAPEKDSLLARLDPNLPQKELGRLCFEALFGVKNEHVTEELAKRRYIEYHAKVRRLVPKERLLECDVKDGWVPLCRFLEKDVPDEPFPNVNTRQEFQKRTAGQHSTEG
ncbi:hypothetical protein R3P38DRAFT_2818788 [Favolaschia claudopus]|uniref:P-loop containing nucleoside triphosphate hydrolase protein n=1 Tax=Favolaschia claudopus TaxID=2862362 RepID=A0AAW0EF75_9AGAR